MLVMAVLCDELEQNRLAAALARAQDACSRLGDDSPVRSKMQVFLDAQAPKLQLDRAHRGERPSMKAAGLRRHDDLRLPAGHPLKALREYAYDRVEELLDAGWPPLTRTEKRQKAQRLADSTGARVPWRRAPRPCCTDPQALFCCCADAPTASASRLLAASARRPLAERGAGSASAGAGDAGTR